MSEESGKSSVTMSSKVSFSIERLLAVPCSKTLNVGERSCNGAIDKGGFYRTGCPVIARDASTCSDGRLFFCCVCEIFLSCHLCISLLRSTL